MQLTCSAHFAINGHDVEYKTQRLNDSSHNNEIEMTSSPDRRLYFRCYWLAKPGIHPLLKNMYLIADNLRCTVLSDDPIKQGDGFFSVPFTIVAPSQEIFEQCLENLKPHLTFETWQAIDSPNKTAKPIWPTPEEIYAVSHTTANPFRRVIGDETYYELLGQYNEAVTHQTPLWFSCCSRAQPLETKTVQELEGTLRHWGVLLFYREPPKPYHPPPMVFIDFYLHVPNVLQAETIHEYLSYVMEIKAWAQVSNPLPIPLVLLTVDMLELDKSTKLDREHITDFVELMQRLGALNQQNNG